MDFLLFPTRIRVLRNSGHGEMTTIGMQESPFWIPRMKILSSPCSFCSKAVLSGSYGVFFFFRQLGHISGVEICRFPFQLKCFPQILRCVPQSFCFVKGEHNCAVSLSRCCIVHPVAIWVYNPLEVNTLNSKKVIALTHSTQRVHVCVRVRVRVRVCTLPPTSCFPFAFAPLYFGDQNHHFSRLRILMSICVRRTMMLNPMEKL